MTCNYIKRSFLGLILTSFFSLSCFLPLAGQSVESAYAAESAEPIELRMVAEQDSVQPDKPFWVALHLTIQPGWHTYWKNPGMTGMACNIQWQLSDGLEVSQVLWPTPKRYEEGELYYFGYEKEAILLVEMMPTKALNANEGAPLSIQANVEWIACNAETCLPGEGSQSITIPVSSKEPKIVDAEIALFNLARHSMPRGDWKMRAVEIEPNLVALTVIPPAQLESWDGLMADFFPEQTGLTFKDAPKSVEILPSNQLRMLIPYHSSDKEQASLNGVVVFAESDAPSDHKASVAINIPVEKYSHQALETSSTSISLSAFLLTLLCAFIGGAILNCMPCVLPVLSVKLMQLMKMAGESRRILMQHAAAYTFGILVSFWALAGAILLLQTYGQSVGWGFQLQEPLFVGLLALFLLLFSLNLFGLFEWGTVWASWAGQATSGKRQTGLFGAFSSGVLATAMATPCTGPFLGSAVGLAVTLSPVLSLLVFTAIALGMSMPYVLLTISPKLMRFLPRPGAWMVRFKEAMGFLLLGTVLWLVYVFAFQTNLFSTLILLTAFLVASFGMWLYGSWSLPFYSAKTRMLATALSCCLIGLSVYIVAYQTSQVKGIQQTGDIALQETDWLKFSPEAVEEVVKTGRPALVDFTASWCLICQANHYVLETQRVREQLDKHSVVRFKADWTLSNPMITKALRQHGRSGVPLYLLYAPYAKEPIILPQLLTQEGVLEALQTMHQEAI